LFFLFCFFFLFFHFSKNVFLKSSFKKVFGNKIWKYENENENENFLQKNFVLQ